MLRVAEPSFHKSDTGRQRRANEDAFFARAPLFVVADGMGGAQAGEVASHLAVDLFQDGLPEEGSNAEERLATTVREANRRIYGLSQEDSSRAGMGTTLTAAYVDGSEVSIAHVGDSRAYCLRDGQLIRLTDDHTLVAELQRRGQLTAEQAVEHPQRSIITRALGPEPEVQVDTRTLQARAGDVYLLCSDGLTSMISEERMAEVIQQAPTLEEAGQGLIAAANEAGGRDNITVVLFRLEEVPEGAGAGQEVGDQATMAGDAAPSADDVQAALAAAQAQTPATQTPAPHARQAPAPAAAPPPPRAEAPPQVRSRRGRARLPRAPAPARRRRRRWPVGAVVTLVLIGLVATGAWIASQTIYFVGTNQSGFITMFRGVPYDLPAGLHLYSTNYVSGVNARQIAPGLRQRLLDHTLRSHSDAADLVRRLELGQLSLR
ncbi:MAG TPA: Stp1/IreP family PP2C-type Ser/Thr phosphatase [Solirubrobacteraceae bacterium]|jgi:protein phosphatase|nr:Stp1/IreP family PP2C-type Ser/Thr phosphatase [Solirubrobacteraceae bacterium]